MRLNQTQKSIRRYILDRHSQCFSSTDNVERRFVSQKKGSKHLSAQVHSDAFCLFWLGYTFVEKLFLAQLILLSFFILLLNTTILCSNLDLCFPHLCSTDTHHTMCALRTIFQTGCFQVLMRKVGSLCAWIYTLLGTPSAWIPLFFNAKCVWVFFLHSDWENDSLKLCQWLFKKEIFIYLQT